MALAHDKLKQTLAGAKAGFGWKPKDGENKIVVLPPGSTFVNNLDGFTDISWRFRGHYFRIEGRQGEASRCLQDLGEACPACAMVQHYRNSTDPAMAEKAKQLRAAEVYVINVIDINNPAKGVQRWGANWTCWTKIMEVAANPDWGYVYDPNNAVVFVVKLTPRGQSKTGYNSYEVTPTPNRVSVTKLIAEGEGGWGALDGMEDGAMASKSAAEVTGLLKEMGFPVQTAPGSPTPPPAPVASPPPAAPGIVPMAMAPPMVPPPSVAPPVSTAAPVAPGVVPVGNSAAAPPLTATPPATPSGMIHYDPGPGYTPKLADNLRPPGVPRCFGDYNPGIHQCKTCPVMADCQFKMIGVAPPA
jgi:hypothetical protein